MTNNAAKQTLIELRSISDRIALGLNKLLKSMPMTMQAIDSQALQLAQQRRELIEHQAELTQQQQNIQVDINASKDQKSSAKADNKQAIQLVKQQRANLKEATVQRESCEKSIDQTKREIKKTAVALDKLNNAKKPIQTASHNFKRATFLSKKAHGLVKKIKIQRNNLFKKASMQRDELAILNRHEVKYPGKCSKEIAVLQRDIVDNKRQRARLRSKQQLISIKASQYDVEKSSANIELLVANRELKTQQYSETSIDVNVEKLQQQLNTLSSQLGKQQLKLTAAKKSESVEAKELKSCERNQTKTEKKLENASQQLSGKLDLQKQFDKIAAQFKRLSDKISDRFSQLKAKLNPKAARDNPMAKASRQPSPSDDYNAIETNNPRKPHH